MWVHAGLAREASLTMFSQPPYFYTHSCRYVPNTILLLKRSINLLPTLLSSLAGHRPETQPCWDITLYQSCSPDIIQTSSCLLLVLRRNLGGINGVAISLSSNLVTTLLAWLCLTICACVWQLCSATRFSISKRMGLLPNSLLSTCN
jgi:hypothetical protein